MSSKCNRVRSSLINWLSIIWWPAHTALHHLQQPWSIIWQYSPSIIKYITLMTSNTNTSFPIWFLTCTKDGNYSVYINGVKLYFNYYLYICYIDIMSQCLIGRYGLGHHFKQAMNCKLLYCWKMLHDNKIILTYLLTYLLACYTYMYN